MSSPPPPSPPPDAAPLDPARELEEADAELRKLGYHYNDNDELRSVDDEAEFTFVNQVRRWQTRLFAELHRRALSAQMRSRAMLPALACVAACDPCLP